MRRRKKWAEVGLPGLESSLGWIGLQCKSTDIVRGM